MRFFCCYVLICMKFTLNKNIFNIHRNVACASTLNMYCAYWGDKLFWWHVISHGLMHPDIFCSLATTPKSVHCKHPDLFRKFFQHLIVELEMCENTNIGVWWFSGISSRIQPLAHMPCCLSWSFYPKTVKITCPKWNAYELIYRS